MLRRVSLRTALSSFGGMRALATHYCSSRVAPCAVLAASVSVGHRGLRVGGNASQAPPFRSFSSLLGNLSDNSSAAVRRPSSREAAVLKVLCTVKHPEDGKDIVLREMVSSVTERNGVVSISLSLDQHYRAIRKEIETALLSSSLSESSSVPDSPSLESSRVSAFSSFAASLPLTRIGGTQSSPAAAPSSAGAERGWLRSVRVSIAPASAADRAALSPPRASGGHRQGAAAPGTAGARGLASVKHVVAVSSGKGGVGKSTVAVNLAYALAGLESAPGSAPLRVGLLDCDVHGPSLPVMVSPSSRMLREHRTPSGDSLIEPLTYEGVRLMSYGWVPPSRVIVKGQDGAAAGPTSDAGSAAIMRGPMVAQLVNELATRTNWGDLDFLIVDMPPGTGDVALTLTQNVRLSGAVVVTTPQRLAFVDVAKGIELFDATRVPVLAVVENMAFYRPPGDTRRHFIFGDSSPVVQRLREGWGVDAHFSLPLIPQLAAQGDAGDPFVLAAAKGGVAAEAPTTVPHSSSTPASGQPLSASTTAAAAAASGSNTRDAGAGSHGGPRPGDVIGADASQVAEVREAYLSLAAHVSEACSPEAIARRAPDWDARYDSAANAVILAPKGGGQPRSIGARELRLACRCAGCVHEWTGQPILKPHTVPKDVYPTSLTPRGRYALSVTWSDGHKSSMYPWKQLADLTQPAAAHAGVE